MPTYPSGLRFERIVVPTPFKVGPANVYAITADPITLIDSGTNTPETENALRLGLAAIGVYPEQIAQVVVTHGHPDHFGPGALDPRSVGRAHHDRRAGPSEARRRSLDARRDRQAAPRGGHADGDPPRDGRSR